MAIVQKSYSGGGAATTLTGAINSSATSIAVVATTGYPNTAIGPFVVVIDRGTAAEEKILISAYTSTNLTAETRGYDGTAAQSHSFGATLVPCLDAITVQEAHDFAALVGTVTPSTSAVGDAAADGSSTVAPAADHKHGREAFGSSATASAVGDSEAAGSATTPSRSDHAHGREAFGSSATASAPGDSESAGSATTPSRSDHKHGREATSSVLGALLAVVDYAGTNAAIGLNTSSLTALDGTNLTISFTVPASGNIIITSEICTYVATTASGAAQNNGTFGWLNHSGAAQVGSEVVGLSAATGSGSTLSGRALGRAVCTQEITGLTPGALQLDLAGVLTGTGSAAVGQVLIGTVGGGVYGPALLRVWGA